MQQFPYIAIYSFGPFLNKNSLKKSLGIIKNNGKIIHKLKVKICKNKKWQNL